MLGVNPDAEREENDFYATDPWAIYKSQAFFNEIGLSKDTSIWEPACGLKHLSGALSNVGYNVITSDLVQRGNMTRHEVKDFLDVNNNMFCPKMEVNILTNPPFKLAPQFIEKSMELLNTGYLAIFFLKIQFLETPKRARLFKECGLKYVGVFSERICCAKNGEFDKYFKQDDTGRYKGGTQLYAWFVFQKGYKGNTELRWIN